MGKYDVLDKKYFGSKERLAELISVTLFKSRVELKAEDLLAISCEYPSFVSVSGELARDGLWLCELHKVKYGLEVENYNDYGMPRRALVYDAAEYEKEVSERKETLLKERKLGTFEERKSGKRKIDKEYPIINIVLYLGMGRYQGPHELRDCFYEIPKEYAPYLQGKINSYGFVLLEADYIKTELFQSELKQFFEAMQARNDKQRLHELFNREDFQTLSPETQQMITIHIGDKHLTRKVMEEKVDMCKAMRDLKRDWKKEGRAEGIDLTLKENITNLMKNLNWSVDQAMDALSVTETKREILRKSING